MKRERDYQTNDKLFSIRPRRQRLDAFGCAYPSEDNSSDEDSPSVCSMSEVDEDDTWSGKINSSSSVTDQVTAELSSLKTSADCLPFPSILLPNSRKHIAIRTIDGIEDQLIRKSRRISAMQLIASSTDVTIPSTTTGSPLTDLPLLRGSNPDLSSPRYLKSETKSNEAHSKYTDNFSGDVSHSDFFKSDDSAIGIDDDSDTS